jgi:hypothetical protein
MNESFDPYLRWLGIRDPERPPNHYRLLGIDVFESDPDVIATAADRQMAHVRRFQSGSHVQASQDLLNELAAAKLLLLSPEKKAAYDRTLQQTTTQELVHTGRVVRWGIICVAAVGVLAMGIAVAKRDTDRGERSVKMADAADEERQADAVVTDELPLDENDAVDRENAGDEEGSVDSQEDDTGAQTYDNGSAEPVLSAVPPDTTPPDTTGSDGQAPTPSRYLSSVFETETVDKQPIEIRPTGTILDDIKKALSEGDLKQARFELAEAGRSFPNDVWFLIGLTRTTNLLDQFQLALRTALNGGVPARTLLDFGSTTIVVESVDDTQIVLANGDRKRFSDPTKLPPLLAEALAKHVLQDSGNQQADLVMGAFWAFREQGNREKADVYFDTARHLGADVDLLLESWQADGSGSANVRTTHPTDRLSVPKRNDFNTTWKQIKTELSLQTRITTETRKSDMAKFLIRHAARETDPVKQYVCLDRGVYYATLSGDTDLALKAIDKIVETYDVDVLTTRHKCLERLNKSATDRRRAAQVAQAALRAMEDSIDQNDYPHARRFLKIATPMSKRSQNSKLVDRTNELRLLLRRLSAAKTRS